MKRLLSVYAWLLLIIFGGIVLHAPFSVAFGSLLPEFSDLIKAWKEILMLVALGLALVLVQRHKLWRSLASDWLIRLIGVYAALHLVLLPVFWQGLTVSAAGLVIDLRYLLFFVLVYVLIKIAPQYRRLMLWIGLGGAFVVVGFATLQLFLPPDFLTILGYGPNTISSYLTVDRNPDYIRINSTLRGPNPLGAYVVIVLGLLVAAFARGRWQLTRYKQLATGIALGIMSGLALWYSYSRSAAVGAAAAVGIVLAATVLRKLPRGAWIGLSIVVFALAGGLIASRDSDFVANVILHNDPDTGAAETSNEGHLTSLQYGVSQLIKQPLGAGIGSTGSASLYGDEPNIIENQYLFIAHETGWLGLVLFMAIFVLVLVRLWQRRADWLALGVFASGVGLALIGILLPVWADDTVSIVWWGLAGLALAMWQPWVAVGGAAPDSANVTARESGADQPTGPVSMKTKEDK